VGQPKVAGRQWSEEFLSREGPKNCWTLAERAAEARPWGMQHLLARAV
jgi:hypothetical protein